MVSQIELFKSLSFEYSPGWKSDSDLAVQLVQNFERDSKLGYTSKGPHKADINFMIDGVSVDNYLSRGQLKLLMYALKICQNSLIESETQKQSLFLIDDLPSELSNDTKQIVSSLLANSQSQIFITAIDFDSISAVVETLSKNMKVFHVKHGKLIIS
jgi:DNA replication and repair protein RecF